MDNDIRLDFLRDHIGLDGSVLDLFRSYLSGRTQCVSVAGVLSELSELKFSVQQSSVLDPIELRIYTVPLGAKILHCKIEYHIYPNDTQLYCSFDINSPDEALHAIDSCISDIRSWMIGKKLKINDCKTEILIITSPNARFSANLQLKIVREIVLLSTSCKSHGVMFDDHMQIDAHVSHICRTTHFHLRSIGAVRNLLTESVTEQLIHSLVMPRLDYCNSLLNRVQGYKLKRLQRMQNIAARIVSKCPYRDHITPVLESLHWLPVKYRILFKLLLLTYKSLNGFGPGYLSCLGMPRKHRYEPRPQYQRSARSSGCST